ncbi:MAG TPA: hypothetical protein VIF10_18080 [Methylobacter sp.]|jgi:hypothetical protein
MRKYLIGRRVPVIERLILEITVNRCAQRQDRHPQRVVTLRGLVKNPAEKTNCN